MIWVFLCVIMLFLWWLNGRERDGCWHHDDNDRMKRFINGRWQYRAMTVEEAEEWQQMKAW